MSRSGPAFEARPLVEGTATGAALVLSEPLSFWGGLNHETGEVIDRHHPQAGEVVSGRVLVMPRGRGSSSSSSTLAEALSNGVGPAAIILSEIDPIVALGSLVVQELHGRSCPIVVLPSRSYGVIKTGDPVEVRAAADPPALVFVAASGE
jgi:predicted aconitase with swiveling domain